MSDILNIRVATDLTDRQNNILREEKSAGRQVYFHNGRLCYRERRSPPAAASASPARLGVVPTALQTIPPAHETNGAQQERSIRKPSHSLILRHGRVPAAAQTDDGTEPTSDRDSQGAQATQQLPVQRQPPSTGSPVAKQCRGPEDSSHRDTRTTTTQTSRDGPGTTAPSSPSRSIDVQPPIFRRTPIEEILVVNMHSLQTASPVATKPFDTQDTNDASVPRTPTMPRDAAVDHVPKPSYGQKLTAQTPPQHAMSAATSEHPGAPTLNHHPIMSHSQERKSPNTQWGRTFDDSFCPFYRNIFS